LRSRCRSAARRARGRPFEILADGSVTSSRSSSEEERHERVRVGRHGEVVVEAVDFSPPR
jgi:hypothetical protein